MKSLNQNHLKSLSFDSDQGQKSDVDKAKFSSASDHLERRTTSQELKNQMASIASNGHFSVKERLKVFRNKSPK